MSTSFSLAEILVWLFTFSAQPPDLLAVVEPKLALECLGEKTDDESLRRLVQGLPPESPAGAVDEKEVKTAIQNLASRSVAVRESARDKLASFGERVRAQLEAVVAGDPKRADEAKLVLAKLDADREASAARRDVARILAVRLGAEKKLASLAPEIEKCAGSDDPFLRAASRAALAAIRGEPAPAAEGRPWASSLHAIEALPRATRFVLRAGQLAPRADEKPAAPVTVRGIVQAMRFGLPSDDDVDTMVRDATRSIVEFAVRYGNLRPAALACANVGPVGPEGGGIALILTGEYQRAVLERGLSSEGSGWSLEKLGDWSVFRSRGTRIVPLDEHTVLVLPEDASSGFPLEEYLKNWKEGKRPLSEEKRWKAFLGTLSGDAVARGLAVTDDVLMSQLYEGIEEESPGEEVVAAVKGMAEIELDVRKGDGEKIAFRLEAAFKTSENASALAEFVKAGIESGTKEMEAEIGEMEDSPFGKMAKVYLDAMKSIRVVADGKRGVLRGEFDAGALGGLFFGFSLGIR